MTAKRKTLKMKQFKCFCTTYACTIPKAAVCTPKRGAHKRSSGKGGPKKDRAVRKLQGSNRPHKPFTTYNTRVCFRVSNESSTMDKPTEYFDSTRKACKKTGSGDSSQMAYLTENLTKLN